MGSEMCIRDSTNGSQFFITHVPTPHLDDAHSIFGTVQAASDQDVVNAIAQGDKIESLTFSGDTDAVLAAHADQINEWNQSLS